MIDEALVAANQAQPLRDYLGGSRIGEPFPLYPHLTIIAPGRWWQAIKRDIAAGPGVARAMYGALQNDLKRLAELFGGPDVKKQLTDTLNTEGQTVEP